MRAKADPVYDVVIVGGGISGLMAAHELRDLNVLVLEKEGRPGGRILTRSRSGIAYDLGAVFASDPRLLPFELQPGERIHEGAPVGIYYHGGLYYGRTVNECIQKMGLEKQDLDIISAFQADPARDARSLPGHIYKILNAFFQVIHPGEMADYLPVRQADSFIRFDTSHYIHGNGAWLEELRRRSGATVELDAQVASVVEKDGWVEVTFHQDGRKRTLRAKTAVLTPPAPAVLEVLQSMNDTCRSFLSSMRYGQGMVVVLCLQGVRLADFAYIVTPALATSTVLRQRTVDPDRHLLLCYFAGDKASSLKDQPGERIIEITLDCLGQMEIGPIQEKQLLFADRRHWPMVGPIISAQAYTGWEEQVLRPSGRVFLAGDYVHVTTPDVLPYGLVPALRSGETAARTARSFLTEEGFRSRFLVKASRYELTQAQPVFRGTVEEGNIALYGLILQAHGDEHLKRYLLRSARDSLWEWQSGFGVTAEDSALVIEGLLTTSVDRSALVNSAECLVERFFSPDDGAFHTIRRGRAAYWQGPSLDATGHIGYLLLELAPDTYAKEIGACADYLYKVQTDPGCWRGKWFPSAMITTYYAVRFLHRMGEGYADAVRKATCWILASQNPNGSWNGSVIDTSAATLALKSIRLESPARTRAEEWLLTQKGVDGWQGEPILYYWFEIDPERKLFYHCADKGEVTTAWALLALYERTC